MTALRAMEKVMTCAEFQASIPDLFEAHADFGVQEHIRTCENCAALVRDLEYIAAQARLLLPIHDPSPAVWDNIQQAIRKEPQADTPPSSAGRK